MRTKRLSSNLHHDWRRNQEWLILGGNQLYACNWWNSRSAYKGGQRVVPSDNQKLVHERGRKERWRASNLSSLELLHQSCEGQPPHSSCLLSSRCQIQRTISEIPITVYTVFNWLVPAMASWCARWCVKEVHRWIPNFLHKGCQRRTNHPHGISTQHGHRSVRDLFPTDEKKRLCYTKVLSGFPLQLLKALSSKTQCSWSWREGNHWWSPKTRGSWSGCQWNEKDFGC